MTGLSVVVSEDGRRLGGEWRNVSEENRFLAEYAEYSATSARRFPTEGDANATVEVAPSHTACLCSLNQRASRVNKSIRAIAALSAMTVSTVMAGPASAQEAPWCYEMPDPENVVCYVEGQLQEDGSLTELANATAAATVLDIPVTFVSPGAEFVSRPDVPASRTDVVVGESLSDLALSMKGMQGGECATDFAYEYDPILMNNDTERYQGYMQARIFQSETRSVNPHDYRPIWEIAVCVDHGAQSRNAYAFDDRLRSVMGETQLRSDKDNLLEFDGGYGEDASRLRWAATMGILGNSVDGTMASTPTGLYDNQARIQPNEEVYNYTTSPHASGNRNNRTFTWWEHNSPVWVHESARGSTDFQGNGSVAVYRMSAIDQPSVVVSLWHAYHGRCYDKGWYDSQGRTCATPRS